MSIREQLTDSGAVIGYRPDLKYEKTNTFTNNTSDVTTKYVNNNKNYTKNKGG